jgi:hypothetical protein
VAGATLYAGQNMYIHFTHGTINWYRMDMYVAPPSLFQNSSFGCVRSALPCAAIPQLACAMVCVRSTSAPVCYRH